MVVPIVIPVHAKTHPHYTKDQWTFVIIFLVTMLAMLMVYSFQGPLYPPEATLRGLLPADYGIVMSSYMAGTAVSSFFAIKFEKIGLRNVLVGSTCTFGVGTLILGLVSNVESSSVFAISSAIAFFIQGVSFSGALASCYLLCFSIFPTKTSTAIGLIESGALAGACFGPIFCEMLFTRLGFQLTYVTAGIVVILYGIFILYKLPPEPEPTGIHLTIKDMCKGYAEMIQIPSILLFVSMLAFLEMGSDYLSTILEPGLKDFNLSRIQVGITFSLIGLPQLLAPLWGYALDKVSRPEIILTSGVFIIAASTFFIGPLPFIPLNRSYSLTVFGVLLFGLGQGIMDVSAVVNFQLEVKQKRTGESPAINFSFVAIIYAFTSGIGGIAGPFLAGVMFQYFSFQKALIFIFITHGTLGIALILFMLKRKCKPRNVALTLSLYETLE